MKTKLLPKNELAWHSLLMEQMSHLCKAQQQVLDLQPKSCYYFNFYA